MSKVNFLAAWSMTAVLLCRGFAAGAEMDPYENYVKTSKDFRPVKQDKGWLLKAYPSWLYMPWTYQWTIGYTDASAKWSLEHGYNGAFVDRGEIGTRDSRTGRIDWINKFGLRFYMDHLAGKGELHLWDGGIPKNDVDRVHGGGVRVKPVNEAMRRRLHQLMARNIAAVKSSPVRAAYALDDEISWGHFVHPTMWRVTDDEAAYPAWLKEIYGPRVPQRTRWVTYEDIRPKLADWSVKEFDASALMDQWTFNDSYWNNFIGDLVEFSNRLDPATPCGWVGGQSPNAFGGYDYAKVMRKVQFLESYNIGGSQAIIRSFNPHNAIPAVTTHFHRTSADTIWQTWYYLAHGNRGFIGWVEKWFDGTTPKRWHDEVAPHFLAAGQKIGPLMSGAEWLHDGVAIYYSHASIQLGWILDAAAHGKTWINRNGDERIGSSHQGRKAWENMLRDSGLQYSYLSYADVIAKRHPGGLQGVDLAGMPVPIGHRGQAHPRVRRGRRHGDRRLHAGPMGPTRQGTGQRRSPRRDVRRQAQPGPQGVRRVRRQTLVRTQPGCQLWLEDLPGVPQPRQHLHQGCDRLRQGSSQHGGRQGPSRRERDGRPDEPVAAVVQRLPRRGSRIGRQAIRVYRSRPVGGRPALGESAGRRRKGTRLRDHLLEERRPHHPLRLHEPGDRRLLDGRRQLRRSQGGHVSGDARLRRQTRRRPR